MKTKFILSISAALLGCSTLFSQKYEGLADTPPMGWNSWNKFACNIDEATIRSVADAMIESGLADAGYRYVNLDDCWHGQRDSLGFIQCNSEKFPSGIKALADYVHSKGLKIGIYSDAGRKTCGGHPGSFGHEYQDALTYAKWGIDYLKYDWCESENINAKGAYMLMRDAIRSAGRPILLSMCEWGHSKPWEWAADTGHSWRTTGDIFNCFDCVDDHGDWKAFGVLQILAMQDGLRRYAGPGHWNDPDMLEVGNGQTVNEDRAHFSMWCMLAAPLILGNDVRDMSAETRSIVTNREVIAVDQDSLGIQGLKYLDTDGLQVWFKPLAGGDWAFCILNTTQEENEFLVNWQEFNFTDEVSGRATEFDKKIYNICNLWNAKSKEGTTKKSKAVVIPGRDVVMYRLSPKAK